MSFPIFYVIMVDMNLLCRFPYFMLLWQIRTCSVVSHIICYYGRFEPVMSFPIFDVIMVDLNLFCRFPYLMLLWQIRTCYVVSHILYYYGRFEPVLSFPIFDVININIISISVNILFFSFFKVQWIFHFKWCGFKVSFNTLCGPSIIAPY